MTKKGSGLGLLDDGKKLLVEKDRYGVRITIENYPDGDQKTSFFIRHTTMARQFHRALGEIIEVLEQEKIEMIYRALEDRNG